MDYNVAQTAAPKVPWIVVEASRTSIDANTGYQISIAAGVDVIFRVCENLRSGSGQTSEAPTDALVIDVLAEDDNRYDDPMVEAVGNELMIMEEDDFLGDDLQEYHPMEEEVNNIQKEAHELNDHALNAIVLFDQNNVDDALTDSASKPSKSVSRVLFPNKDSSQQPKTIRIASPRL